MKLSKEKITTTLEQKGWSQNELVRKIGVSHGALSNAINGHKGAGRKLLAGLLRVLPQESVVSLTVDDRRVAM